MTVVLGHPVAVGEAVVAALICNSISEHRLPRHVWLTGSRRPVAILVRRGDDVIAFTPEGNSLAAEDVEDLCPGAIQQFLSEYLA